MPPRCGSTRCFFYGEDSVADNLSPFIDAAPTEEQKYFLATQQVDEVRDAVFFHRFFTEVIGAGDDVASTLATTHDHLNWGCMKVFNRLDQMAGELRRDRSLPKFAQAITLCHLIVEGTRAQPGQHYIEDFFVRSGSLPGFSQGMQNVSRDEQRHIGFGVKVRSELIADPGSGGPLVTEISHDNAGLVKRVDQAEGRGEDGIDTAYAYDRSGNVETLKANGRLSEGDKYLGGQISRYTYNPAERERSATVERADESFETSSRWWPSGQLRRRVKPNGTVERRFYKGPGEISQMTRTASDGTEQKNTRYTYDKNANRTADEQVFPVRTERRYWSRSKGEQLRCGAQEVAPMAFVTTAVDLGHQGAISSQLFLPVDPRSRCQETMR